MFNTIKKQLKAMRPKPLTPKESQTMWSKIEHYIGTTREEKGVSSLYPYASVGFFVNLRSRFVLVPLLIAALLGTSTLTAFAANNAKPGDLLFPVDLAAEKLYIIISSKEKKDFLRIKFAKERFKEAKIILAILAEEDETRSNNTTNATTTTQTSQETNNATTTNETAENNTTPHKTKYQKRSERAARNLATALEFLEKTKTELNDGGNNIAALAVEEIIAEITDLTENNTGNFKKLKVEFKEHNGKVKVEIKVSNNEKNIKFKLEQKEKEQKIEIKTHDQDGKKEIKISNDSVKIEMNYPGLTPQGIFFSQTA